MKRRAPRYSTAELAASERRALDAKATFYETEAQAANERAAKAEQERDEQSAKWRAAVADRDVLLAMLRSETGRAQAAVLTRLLVSPALPADDPMVLRWNASVRDWESAQVERINAEAEAKVAEINKNYDDVIAAIDTTQRRIKRTLAKSRASR